MTATIAIPCDIGCGRDAVHVVVNPPEGGFASQLCPLHLAAFMQHYMDCPERACEGLPGKRVVKPDQ